jgi:hypothetical protein
MNAMRSWIAAALILCASAASAQTAPRQGGGDPLEEICSGFLDQNNLSIGGNAGKLCTCLVREVKGKLSRREMEVYDQANAVAKPLPPALQEKITGIAVQCLTEAR